jgi:hypothetical protein
MLQIIGEPLPDGDLACLTRVFNGVSKGSSNGKVALVELLALLDKEEQEAQDEDTNRAVGTGAADASLIGAHHGVGGLYICA